MPKKKPIRRREPPAPKPLPDLPALRQARALWQRDKLVEAVALFERTLAENPDHPIAAIDTSRAFGAVYRVRDAEAVLARLETRIQRKPRLLHLAGQSYRLLRRPEAARRCFETAVRIDPGLADTHLELSLLAERIGDLAAAEEHANERLKLVPSDAEALVVRGRVKRRQGEQESAIAALRKAATTPDAHWLTRSRAHSELALALEARGEHSAAWRAALQGKALAKPFAEPVRKRRDGQMKVFSRLIEELTAEQLRSWQTDSNDREETLLLTGMPRSGTTLLQQVLGAHPDVVCCDEYDAFPRLMIPIMLGNARLPELDATTLSELSDRNLAAQRRMYRRFMRSGVGEELTGRVLLDKNPSLLPVAPLFRRLVPRGSLVVCLRDPRDVLVSCVLNHFPLNDFSVDFLELESAVDRIELDLRLWSTFREKMNGGWLEVRYEDIVSDLRGGVAPVLQAVGRDWRDQMHSYRDVGTNRLVQSPTYAEVAKPVYRHAIGRWRNFESELASVRPRLDRIARSIGYES